MWRDEWPCCDALAWWLQVDSITIPVGPRLGDKVLDVENVSKAYGDRLLVDGMTFSVPPGK